MNIFYGPFLLMSFLWTWSLGSATLSLSLCNAMQGEVLVHVTAFLNFFSFFSTSLLLYLFWFINCGSY
ncbi:hypothetical protein Scep_020058 [Stephania cephalantha]|uniref:NADH dehydrogenase subunit 4 n=1 Tax=Stephania cephalantha TaxID=152367 RepID=A0AAP0NNL2_9MAGN